MYYYNNSLQNERDVYHDHELLPQYYSGFLSDIDEFETTLVCQKANEMDSDFSIYGCMNDLHGLTSIGIRQAIGVCSMEWLKLYYSFLSESNFTDPQTVSKYLHDPNLFDTCKQHSILKFIR